VPTRWIKKNVIHPYINYVVSSININLKIPIL
jgi:hypothetical protein